MEQLLWVRGDLVRLVVLEGLLGSGDLLGLGRLQILLVSEGLEVCPDLEAPCNVLERAMMGVRLCDEGRMYHSSGRKPGNCAAGIDQLSYQ